MKKSCLLFMILCAPIGFSIKSAELPKEEGKNFSLKNRSQNSIYFMVVSDKKLKGELLRSGDLADDFFEKDDLSNIIGSTRLYIWQENLLNFVSSTFQQKLKKEVFKSRSLPINEINFSFKPDLVFEFLPGKAIHLKWKKRVLLPREGKNREKMGKRGIKYTSEGYSLINNVTKDDIWNSTWVSDDEGGCWLDRKARFEQDSEARG